MSFFRLTKISVFILCVVTVVFAREKADFIFLKNPEGFTVYNRYQQMLNSEEKRQLGARGALRVVNPEETLGDGITAAAHVRTGKIDYYIQKNDSGKYLCHDNASVKNYNNCQIAGDTIQVLKDRNILVTEEVSGTRHYLKKGSLHIRLFKHRKGYYLVALNGKTNGWSALPSTGAWQVCKQADQKEKTTDLSGDLYGRIQKRIENANRSYQDYFRYFNRTTGQDLSIPGWKMEKEENSLRYVLTGARARAEQLSGSTEYLVQDIENMLLGKAYKVESRGREIHIYPRGN